MAKRIYEMWHLLPAAVLEHKKLFLNKAEGESISLRRNCKEESLIVVFCSLQCKENAYNQPTKGSTVLWVVRIPY